jgi:hypothetical protein
MMPWTIVDAKVPLIEQFIIEREGGAASDAPCSYRDVVQKRCDACGAWIKEQTDGGCFYISERGPKVIQVRFEDPQDAFAFKMRFG